jgi:hypothetical protein
MRQVVLVIMVTLPAFAQTAGVVTGGSGIGVGGGIGPAITFTGGGMGVSSRGNNNEVTFTYNIPKDATVFSVTGAPYSGHTSSQTVRTLANGTHLTQQAFEQPMTYRDTMGRTRTESRMQPAPPNSKAQPQIGSLPEIIDPVAGYRYILDPVHQIAHRVVVQARQNQAVSATSPAAAARMAVTQPPRTRDDGATVQTESLGTQTMFGIPVTGRRITTTYPVGTYQGNDQPVTMVNEMWNSVQYGMLMRSSNTGPDADTTTVIKDFSTDEPDPSLFMVPSGYQIVDETGEFTITIPRNSQ